jgi:hypothetical protein
VPSRMGGAGMACQLPWKEEPGAFAKNGAHFVHEAAVDRVLGFRFWRGFFERHVFKIPGNLFLMC